jgi:DNA replication and repair protein RecF
VAARLRFKRLSVQAFRNLESLEISPGPSLNVIVGDNGQGKTSLLEALYFVASTRSFRTERLEELVRHGSEVASVRAEVAEGDYLSEQRAAFGKLGRSVLLDGKKPERLASYATRTPVVVFHPGDVALVSAPAAGRRKLLDRVALYLDPLSTDARLRYTRAVRERQVVLETRGLSAPELEAFETVIAEHGVRFARARERAASTLLDALGPAFQRIASPKVVLVARYRPGGVTDTNTFASELGQRRALDLRKHSASFGPQKDELELSLDGRSARRHASQGQQRILALALKAAELACVREARGAHPVLLLDDVSSELDPSRTGAVYEFLHDTESQVFVTTTRPELFPLMSSRAADRADFELISGRVTAM